MCGADKLDWGEGEGGGERDQEDSSEILNDARAFKGLAGAYSALTELAVKSRPRPSGS